MKTREEILNDEFTRKWGNSFFGCAEGYTGEQFAQTAYPLIKKSMQTYADQECAAKDAEIAELKRLNESNDVAIHEREVMIQAFKVIREAFESREWITQGRGCYKYNDDRYMEEAKYLFNDFKKIESEMWRQIKSKSYEYKKSIESPLLSKLAELKRRVAELEQNAPKLVLPSVEEMRKYLNGYFGFGGDPSISDREYGFEHGYDYTIDEIKRLNGI